MTSPSNTVLHHPATREEWLKLRHQDISSTESAGLLYCSPYTTALELAVSKRDPEPSALELGERADWGIRLQRAIADGLADEFDVAIDEVAGYANIPELRMGSSFDYKICGVAENANNILAAMYDKHGHGILEIKNVDSLVYKNTWEEHDGVIDAPKHIEIQLQHQLDVLGYAWGALGVLVGGNRAKIIVRERDPEIGALIRAKIKWFWDLYDRHELPPVKYPEDNQAIIKLYSDVEPNKILDARNDDDIIGLCEAYTDAAESVKQAELEKETVKAKLLQRIVNAEKVLVPGFSFSAAQIAPTRVEAFERKGYRNFRITRKK